MTVLVATWCSTACAGSNEQSARRHLAERPAARATSSSPRQQDALSARKNEPPESLAGYVAHALRHNPDLHASFEQWRASVHRISRARRLPEPTIGFHYFVRSVETRVGPQLARISLQQSFPWPTQLSAGADAASAQAGALERNFDAQATTLARRVADAYWGLWQVRRVRSIHREHLSVVQSLSESARARVATGSTTLADLQQVDLAAARLEDLLLGMDEEERTKLAALRAALGGNPPDELPTPDEPPHASLPAESEQTLRTAALSHPQVTTFESLAHASLASAKREEAEGYPNFAVGVDWILTGDSPMPNVADSGKDAVIVGASVRVPLWQGSYDESAQAARAEASSHRARGRAASDRALAELEASLASVRDSARRVSLYRTTLVPQAESAYASVLGAYVTGRGTVASILLAQRDLLELRIELERARTDYAESWARLEQVVGRPVARTSAETPSSAEQSPDDSLSR